METTQQQHAITYTLTEEVSPTPDVLTADELRRYLVDMRDGNDWDLDLDTLWFGEDSIWVGIRPAGWRTHVKDGEPEACAIGRQDVYETAQVATLEMPDESGERRKMIIAVETGFYERAQRFRHAFYEDVESHIVYDSRDGRPIVGYPTEAQAREVCERFNGPVHAV